MPAGKGHKGTWGGRDNLEIPKMPAESWSESYGNPKGYPTYKKKAINISSAATNPRDAGATPRVNIQDFYEEYYEDILPIIMDKVHRDKRKKVRARAHSIDLAKLTRQAQPSPDQTGQASRIILAVEAALIGGTFLMEIVIKVETAPVESGNHMITPTPPTRRGSTIDIAIATETAPAI
nr:hypothetical protein [Tanacetum cinerariifolium]